MMSWHLGMCRAAAVSLKRRLQCGHCTSDGSGAEGVCAGMRDMSPVFSARVAMRAAFIASRNCSDSCFHFPPFALIA